jgi:hypothetical protein
MLAGYGWARENLGQSAERIITRFTEQKRADGYDVVDLESLSGLAMKAMLSDEDVVGWFHIGHGAEGVLDLAGGSQMAPGQYKVAQQHHKWTFVYLYVCQAAKSAQDIGMGWYDLVRQPYGHLYATVEDIAAAGKEYWDLPEWKPPAKK